ncbi:cystatin [Latimeria chalumnae]|nr:PREDICTED: cystatin-like [Latimeria chalumnae]|eukprot:XP_005992993.1 PREDICTED: cystatin-like [Latimeria chalumnae]
MAGWRRPSVLFLIAVLPVAAGFIIFPQNVNSSSFSLKSSADFAVESFNYFSRDEYLYKITKIVSSKTQIVGGPQYTMIVELGKTKCMKEEASNLESCVLQSSGEAQRVLCDFVVLTVPWRDEKRLLHSQCKPTAQEGKGNAVLK